MHPLLLSTMNKVFQLTIIWDLTTELSRRNFLIENFKNHLFFKINLEITNNLTKNQNQIILTYNQIYFYLN